jgi:subtilisin family serine protease
MLGVAAFVAGSAGAAEPASFAVEKVEPLVLRQLERTGHSDFFVWMVERADLSPAARMETRRRKGEFVLTALRDTARRTQREILGLLERRGIRYRSFYIANKILVRAGSRELLEEIAARRDVARITADHVIRPLDDRSWAGGPAEPRAVEPNLQFVGADDVWFLGITGDGMVVANNDTGLDEDHPAIAPHYRGCLNPPACTVEDHNYAWWDATASYPADPWDGHGHGTHTTGVIVGDDGGANQIGMAPGAVTIHCKSMTDGGSGTDTTFTECFEWNLAPWDLSGANPNPSLRPHVVNISWGYYGGGAAQFVDEIQALKAAGIAVVASAGQDGPGCGSLRSPGDYGEVLSVGSVGHAGPFPGTVSGFSARGPSALAPSPPDYFPQVMAPGESIRSSLPGGSYQPWSGSSFSTAHVSGLVALMWSACPVLIGDVEFTRDLIHQYAVPLTGQTGSNCGGDYTDGPNNDWGYGTIDALDAVTAALWYCQGILFEDGFESGDTSAWSTTVP